MLDQPPITDPSWIPSQHWAGWFTQVWRVASTIGQNGPTSKRPTKGLFVGRQFWDITLNKPVFYDGTHWRDAAGTIV